MTETYTHFYKAATGAPWRPLNKRRPIVCVDLNGVFDVYTGWKHEKHWDPPGGAGAGEFLRELNERGFQVIVFTTCWATTPVLG